VPPFGRLYFFSGRGDPADSSGGRVSDERRSEGTSHEMKSARLVCIWTGVAGFVYTTALWGWVPDFFAAPPPRTLPRPASYFETAVWMLSNLPWSILTIVVLCAMIFHSKYQKRSWVLALIVGLLIGRIMQQIFLPMAHS
jgi:hypothetical protein